MQKQDKGETTRQGEVTAKRAKRDSVAREIGNETGIGVEDAASDMMEAISQTASDVREKITDSAGKTPTEALRKVVEGTEHTVEKGKTFTQEILFSLGRALEAGSVSLEEDGMSATASYARATARGLETAAGEIDGLDSGSIAHRLETFVRERPLQTVGLFAVAGFAIATVMKASLRHSDD